MNKKRETSIELLIRKIQVRVARVLKDKGLLQEASNSDSIKSVDTTLGQVVLSDKVKEDIRYIAGGLCNPDIPSQDFIIDTGVVSFDIEICLDRRDPSLVVLKDFR